MSAEATGWVFSHTDYTGDRMVILLAIADTVNDAYDNQFWASVKSLAVKAHTSERTVQRALADFVRDGVMDLTREADHKTPRVYRLNVSTRGDRLSPPPPVGVTTGAGRGDNGVSASSLSTQENPSSLSSGDPDEASDEPATDTADGATVDGDEPPSGYDENLVPLPMERIAATGRNQYPGEFERTWKVFPPRRRVEKGKVYRRWRVIVMRAKGRDAQLQVMRDLWHAARNYARSLDNEEYAMQPYRFFGEGGAYLEYMPGGEKEKSSTMSRLPETLRY